MASNSSTSDYNVVQGSSSEVQTPAARSLNVPVYIALAAGEPETTWRHSKSQTGNLAQLYLKSTVNAFKHMLCFSFFFFYIYVIKFNMYHFCLCYIYIVCVLSVIEHAFRLFRQAADVGAQPGPGEGKLLHGASPGVQTN